MHFYSGLLKSTLALNLHILVKDPEETEDDTVTPFRKQLKVDQLDLLPTGSV